MNSQFYVITPIFNPFRFKSRYRLYHDFAKHMEESGAKLFTIEAAFGNDPFVVTTPSNPMHMQVRTSEILWHKERMINLAYKHLKHVVPDVKFLGWFDADTTFLNPEWVSGVVHKLSYLSVIQPFSQAINLDSDEESMWSCPSSFKSFIDARGYHQIPPLPVSATYKGHPGLAWAATSEAFEGMGGLYDLCVAGSSDTIMSNALKGDWSAYLPVKPGSAMAESMKKWADQAKSAVKNRIGFATGAIAHHWHGKSEDRGYEKRWSVLAFHQFDPEKDLTTDSNGMLKWTGNKPQLEDDVRLSLSGRNEDAPTIKQVYVATHPKPPGVPKKPRPGPIKPVPPRPIYPDPKPHPIPSPQHR